MVGRERRVAWDGIGDDQRLPLLRFARCAVRRQMLVFSM